MKLPAGKEVPYVRRYFKLEGKTFVLVKPKIIFMLGTWYKTRHAMPCMRKVVLEQKLTGVLYQFFARYRLPASAQTS